MGTSLFKRTAFLIALSFLLAWTSPLATGEEAPMVKLQTQLKNALTPASKALVGMDFGEAGFGSGVIVDKTGLILSATHVTSGINRPFTVILPDGRRVRGVTLGLNAEFDGSMARITTPGEYDFVKVSNDLPVMGHWVFALGHAGGFDKDRGFVVRLGKVIHAEPDKIRTDCKLIGGDSGGPLFNMDGELIGIHSRVGRVLEDNIHVPTPLFKKDWQALLNKEWISEGPFAKKAPGKIGAIITETPEGLTLSEITPGIQEIQDKDILLKWNDKSISKKKELEELLAPTYPGLEVTLTLSRNGESLQVPFILKTPPNVSDAPPIRIPDFFDLPDSKEGGEK